MRGLREKRRQETHSKQQRSKKGLLKLLLLLSNKFKHELNRLSVKNKCENRRGTHSRSRQKGGGDDGKSF